MGRISNLSQAHHAVNSMHPLPTVAMAWGNVDVEADPWEATEASLSFFELVVVFLVDTCGVAII